MSTKTEEAKKNGLNIIYTEDIKDGVPVNLSIDINTLLSQPPKNAYMQLKQWREIGKRTLKYIKAVNTFIDYTLAYDERLEQNIMANANKRWTEEEDNYLIEAVCSDVNPFELSTSLGRTPAAIKSRLTKLVGVERISKQVVGTFIGKLDGDIVRGEINGTVYKSTEVCK